MSQLKVVSTADMGPLEVSVYGPGDVTFDFMLSSGATEHSVPASPGKYAVVARRPSGARLRTSVKVGGGDETVHLSSLVGGSPNEFMHQETLRGAVIRDTAADKAAPWRSILSGAAETVLRGAVTETVKGIVPASTAQPVNEISGPLEEQLWRRARPGKWTLRLWSLGDAGWKPGGSNVLFRPIAHVSSEFLKLELVPKGRPLAVGLINEHGVGPIVNVPPFADRVEISFLSRSLATGATDRDHSPGGNRVPAALLYLSNPAAQDLMAALAEPTTPPAEQLWAQSEHRLASPQAPWQMLIEKFKRPAEALLAAHYLLRFLPGRLPVEWADNLGRALPSAMDGPVIAAWARLHHPPEGLCGVALDKAFRQQIELALKRKVALFARTRALLFEALRLIEKPDPLLEDRRQFQYRRHGADAGGLECFWGGDPDSPGKSSDQPGGAILVKVTQEGGAFNAMPPGPGQSLPLLPVGA